MVGLTFQASTGATCKSFGSGGCMLYFFQRFVFDVDSVTLSYPVNANCSSPESNYSQMYNHLTICYKWEIRDNEIYLTGKDFEAKLIQRDHELIAENGLIFKIWTGN